MCELCDIKQKCDDLNEEIEFRIIHFQKAQAFGRQKEASEARARAEKCLGQLFDLLETMPEIRNRLQNGESMPKMH